LHSLNDFLKILIKKAAAHRATASFFGLKLNFNHSLNAKERKTFDGGYSLPLLGKGDRLGGG